MKACADLIFYQSIKDIENNNVLSRFVYTDCLSTARMLLGMSFENIIKGLILASNAQSSKDCMSKSEITHHSLSELVKKIPAELAFISPEDIDLLHDLSSYIVWKGRYPAPKKPEVNYNTYYFRGTHNLENNLWNRLSEALIPYVRDSLN